MTWSPSKQSILWIFVALFLGIATLLGWTIIHQARTTFDAGTRPPLRQSDVPQPIKPSVRAGDPARGSTAPNAVTIIAFGDFDCVFCKLADTSLSQALSTSRDVRMVWRDLPIPNGRPEGLLAAIAGRCAGEQNKFWQMHDALFLSDDLSIDRFKKIANDIGLKDPAFTTCLSNMKVLQDVQDEITLARSLNITSAPTLFIGDEVLIGAVSADEINASVKRARSSAR